MMDVYLHESYLLANLLLQRGLALMFLLAFVGAWNQFPTLLGEKGLLSTPEFLKRAPFSKFPSLFFAHYSDNFLRGVSFFGALLSFLFLIGVMEEVSIWIWILGWTLLWMLYLSIVNIGQRFYSFGWESMMVEAGFFATFTPPMWLENTLIPILLFRWMLFRVEMGAGLIKLRGDPCWKDLTCLMYHHETQPLPNPLSQRFHFSPAWLHKGGVLFSHAVQLVAPFGLFFPQPIAGICGFFIIFHQLILIVSGNYAFLNWITVVLGFSAFSDAQVLALIPNLSEISPETTSLILFNWLTYFIAAFTVILSIKPTLNLFSKNQLMNYCYNSLHLVNTYGAFGSITKERYEIILEGTQDEAITDQSEWKEYEFKAKPGSTKRRPPQIAPYHLRLDWLMWFLPLSTKVRAGEVLVYGYELWFINLLKKFLKNDPQAVKLIKRNPFSEKPPQYIRARFYRYQFNSPKETKQTGEVWRRTLIGEYLPPVSLQYLERL